MRFYTGSMFTNADPSYENAVFIAQRGSWGRDIPIGYRIMVVKLNGIYYFIFYYIFLF